MRLTLCRKRFLWLALALPWATFPASGQATILARGDQESKTVSANAPQVALADALTDLEKQYQVTFAYQKGHISGKRISRPLSKGESLDKYLKEVLSPLNLTFEKIHKTYIISESAKPVPVKKASHPEQNSNASIDIRVKGKVTAKDDGSALAGVNIVIKGTQIGTTTDTEGSYAIQVPAAESVLVFSFLGFATHEVVVQAQTTLDVALIADTRQLSEVVVTAAGIERQSGTLGYSVSTLKAGDVSQKNEPDPMRALTGKLAGVNIQGGGGVAGGSTNVTIRGNSSLGNNNQPLYVVDGVPFDNSTYAPSGDRQTQSNQSTASRAFDIDPNNIQSLTVLKGAAAAALYGSRAANGAIIITTKASSKKGKKGTEITYNSSFSLEEIAGLPDYQHTYGQGTNFDYRSAVYGSNGSAYSSRPTIPHPLARPGYNSTDFPSFYMADGITPVQVPYQSYAGKSQRDFFRTGSVLENALTVNSGSEKGNFTIGLGRTTNKGIVPGNEISRTSFNVGGNIRLDNKFYARGTINYVMTDQKSPPIGGSGDIMSNLYYLPTSYDLSGLPFENPNTGANVYDRDGLDNPYWSVRHSPSTSNVDRYYGNFVLGFDPAPWLNIQNTAGFNAYTDRRMSVLGKGSSVYANGTINTDNIYRQELDNTLLLTVTKDLGPNLALRAILGNNINQRKTERSAFSGDNIITPGINDISNTSTITLGSLPNNRARIKQRYYAFFTDITLDYKKFASLNIVGRNDVSSTLPAQNRSYFYGGANGSFVFTEAFKIRSKALTSGKIRLGYTRVGNEANPYLTTNVYTANADANGLGAPFSNGIVTNVSTLTMSDILTNANLKPEFITEFETGTNLEFFNGRFSFDLTYYHKKSTSQIFTVKSAPSTGSTDRIINLGQTSNRGIEVTLGGTAIEAPNGFRWEVDANFTRNRNMVDDLGGYAQLVYGNNVHIAGQPYGQIYRARYARDEEGNILVNPQTAKPISASTSGVVGNPNPDFVAGISNTLSWKKFTFGVLFDWKQGGSIYSSNVGEAMARGVSKDTEDRYRMLIAPGVLGDVNTLSPILDENGNKIPNNTAITVIDYYFSGGYGPGGVAEGSVFDATVFRLREVSLGYQVPASLLSKTPFGAISISLSGRNLWYNAPNFPKYLNYDPEVSTGAANNGGADAYGVPTTRRYGVNLRISF
ncbi:TonB-linked outer membrane protein, SusC/RagA family [Dyadobacter sp. SG02]|uniref:SusC/RagA family TonB-linked outer membrane protein n=1 Tax=Dyadobacter sp. SG02 TaxID=1855291 RepID=UPI0008D6D439|nr:SusC/RagA family TonB-linked outer membrane protein [Dyadobacter sp. SG02]SEJ36617.1 TonB-linked outer membrane protein, SusC/RagA family [Dyadobacter sp. SG02]